MNPHPRRQPYLRRVRFDLAGNRRDAGIITDLQLCGADYASGPQGPQGQQGRQRRQQRQQGQQQQRSAAISHDTWVRMADVLFRRAESYCAPAQRDDQLAYMLFYRWCHVVQWRIPTGKQDALPLHGNEPRDHYVTRLLAELKSEIEERAWKLDPVHGRPGAVGKVVATVVKEAGSKRTDVAAASEKAPAGQTLPAPRSSAAFPCRVVRDTNAPATASSSTSKSDSGPSTVPSVKSEHKLAIQKQPTQEIERHPEKVEPVQSNANVTTAAKSKVVTGPAPSRNANAPSSQGSDLRKSQTLTDPADAPRALKNGNTDLKVTPSPAEKVTAETSSCNNDVSRAGDSQPALVKETPKKQPSANTEAARETATKNGHEQAASKDQPKAEATETKAAEPTHIEAPKPPVAKVPTQPTSLPVEDDLSRQLAQQSKVALESLQAIVSKKAAKATTTFQPLSTLTGPSCIVDKFLGRARSDIERGVETLGYLYGNEQTRQITHLYLPAQVCDLMSCGTDFEAEMAMMEFASEHSLQLFGWIHTHPQHPLGFSSMDEHMQYARQKDVPEYIGIVVSCESGFDSARSEVYHLDHSSGMETIAKCRASMVSLHSGHEDLGPRAWVMAEHYREDDSLLLIVEDVRFED